MLIIVFFGLFYMTIAQNFDKPYLAPAKDYTPQIYKYIFTTPTDNVLSKQESQETKKKVQSVLSDSTENTIEVNYSPIGEPIELVVTVKEKDKKINITIYNLIGNKVSDVFNAVPGANRIEIDNFKKEVEKLSNGVYICVLQGHNYRLMKKFTVSR